LLGNPYQCPHITDPPGAHGAHRSQVGDGRWIGGPQHGLAREGSLANWIPQGLGCDSVAPTTDRSLEDVKLFHLAMFERHCQAKCLPNGPESHFGSDLYR
jgi:hypothetical protein